MDRGEETDDEPTAHFEVVISGENSATIDGEPVSPAEGATLDSVILDTLHRHAQERNSAVTADISDPSVGYVAYVEVTVDGSSRLLEERGAESVGRDAEVDSAVPAPPEPTAGPPRPPLPIPAPPEPEPEPEPEAGTEPAAVPSSAPLLRINRRNTPRQSDDEFEPPGLLHRPLVVGPVALGVATLIIVPLVMLGSGGSEGGNDTRTARANDEAGPPPGASAEPPEPTPTVSLSPSMSPSPSGSPVKKKPRPKSTPKDKAPGAGGGSDTVTVTATPPRSTVTVKPPQDTAATAVNRLARSDPSGRHICYRVYLSGQGWQKPVCDGTLAGTTGQEKPIKAINYAVAGAGGSAANAFRHNPDSTDGQGEWMASWTAIKADGKNNYIGSTKKSAPYMTGFAINIGNGQICQTAKVRGYDWGGEGCAEKRPDFVFGGTLENTRWLEAVKFRV
ncbi:hypothetical protein [Streptomyces sp. NPDC000983]|uniref:hypothetical protein n=1 Tax=Streptomyces sp. NPDC000983 TaxID=3154373 RepID=UPI00331CEBA0